MRNVIFILYTSFVLFFSLLLYGISAAIVLYKKVIALSAKRFEADLLQKGLETTGNKKDLFRTAEKEKLCIIVSTVCEDAEKELLVTAKTADVIILYTPDAENFTFGLGCIKKLKNTVYSRIKDYKPENIFFKGMGWGCNTLILFRKTAMRAKRIPLSNYCFINMPPDYKREAAAASLKITGVFSPLSSFVVLGLKITDFVQKLKLCCF